MTDDEILFRATRIQAEWPYLKALDFRLLGALFAFDEMPRAYLRVHPDFFGTFRSFEPSLKRLEDAGLIERIKAPNGDVFVRRTKKPLDGSINADLSADSSDPVSDV